jgi:hypothetical protein
LGFFLGGFLPSMMIAMSIQGLITMETVLAIVESLSVGFAAFAVILGVNAWKREFVGRRKIELAEEALTLFYEAKAAIGYMRSPFSNTGEGKSRSKGFDESASESQILDRAYIVVERYQTRETAFTRLNSLKFKLMVYFGKECVEPIDEINRIVNDIFVAANLLGSHYWHLSSKEQLGDADKDKHLERRIKEEKIFWDHGEPDDSIRLRLNKSLTGFENLLMPIFKGL